MLHVERWPEHRVSATPRSRAAIRRERDREILDATRALFDDRPPRTRVSTASPAGSASTRPSCTDTSPPRRSCSRSRRRATSPRSTRGSRSSTSRRAKRPSACAADSRRSLTMASSIQRSSPVALSLLRQSAQDLRAQFSDAVWVRLGRATGACIEWLAGVLHDLGVAERRPAREPALPSGDWSPASHPLRRRFARARGRDGRRLPRQRHDEVRAACVQLALAAAGTL